MAIVGVSLSVSTSKECKPARSISVLIMQGTADPVVPFQGGALGKNGERGLILSHQAAVEEWVDLDHCATPPKKEQSTDHMDDGTSIGTAIYAACAAGTEVRGDAIVAGGHTWPDEESGCQ